MLQWPTPLARLILESPFGIAQIIDQLILGTKITRPAIERKKRLHEYRFLPRDGSHQARMPAFVWRKVKEVTMEMHSFHSLALRRIGCAEQGEWLVRGTWA